MGALNSTIAKYSLYFVQQKQIRYNIIYKFSLENLYAHKRKQVALIGYIKLKNKIWFQ